MTAESTALAIRTPDALASRSSGAPLVFSADERQIIRDSYMPGASEPEARALIAVAEHMRLDPFKRQIHFVKRWNTDLKAMVWAFQTAIDGFRSIAEETGEFRGSDEPQFSFEEVIDPATGAPTGAKELVARVQVHRKDFDKPFVGVARYGEFVQRTREGAVNSMWAKMPRSQLAKCAEAQAFRKAFPQRLAGVYGDEEMPERDVTPAVAPANVQPVTAPVDAEIIEPWPQRFALAQTEAQLTALLAAYQQVKTGLTAEERKAAQGAYKARKDALAVPAAEPPHDPVTGEVREPGAEG